MAQSLHDFVRQVAIELKAVLRQVRQSAGFDESWQSSSSALLTPEQETEAFAALGNAVMALKSTGLVGPDNRLPSQIFWNEVGIELAHGALQLHARQKPRGYAGDHLLLTKIFEIQSCNHPLGRVFDQFFLWQDACQAVRGRIKRAADVLSDALQQRPGDNHPTAELNVTVIGAGPAIEVAQAIGTLKQRASYDEEEITFTLFDLDEEATLAAKANIEAVAPDSRVVLVRENLFRLASQPKRNQCLKQSRCIICLGLLDYLSDEDAAAMIALCWQRLESSGQMLIGNFSYACQARAYMEWIGNWYLIYRTPEDMQRLATAAGIPAECLTIESDPTGVNLLLHATRK